MIKQVSVYPVVNWWWECPICHAYNETHDSIPPNEGDEIYCSECGETVIVNRIEE